MHQIILVADRALQPVFLAIPNKMFLSLENTYSISGACELLRHDAGKGCFINGFFHKFTPSFESKLVFTWLYFRACRFVPKLRATPLRTS